MKAGGMNAPTNNGCAAASMGVANRAAARDGIFISSKGREEGQIVREEKIKFRE